MVMPSCAARSVVAAETRAERKPTVRPARCAQTMPDPSRMSKRLLSLPSACRRILPSVSTPSTSNRISLTFAALAVTDTAGTPGTRSKHLRPPEIVQVHDAGDPVVVGHDDRGDFALFEEVQRLHGE